MEENQVILPFNIKNKKFKDVCVAEFVITENKEDNEFLDIYIIVDGNNSGKFSETTDYRFDISFDDPNDKHMMSCIFNEPDMYYPSKMFFSFDDPNKKESERLINIYVKFVETQAGFCLDLFNPPSLESFQEKEGVKFFSGENLKRLIFFNSSFYTKINIQRKKSEMVQRVVNCIVDHKMNSYQKYILFLKNLNTIDLFKDSIGGIDTGDIIDGCIF